MESMIITKSPKFGGRPLAHNIMCCEQSEMGPYPPPLIQEAQVLTIRGGSMFICICTLV